MGAPASLTDLIFSLRWHYPNQVAGLSMQLTLSLLPAQAPLFILQFFPSAS